MNHSGAYISCMLMGATICLSPILYLIICLILNLVSSIVHAIKYCTNLKRRKRKIRIRKGGG